MTDAPHPLRNPLRWLRRRLVGEAVHSAPGRAHRLEQRMDELERTVGQVMRNVQALNENIQSVNERIVDHIEKIHHLWLTAERVTGLAKDEEPMLARFADFFAQSRGEEETLRTQQALYLPEFEGKRRVIDLGCGRGEFAALLAEKGIAAEGVDIDKTLCEQARAKGLTVHQADLFAWLREQPDASVDGIFCAQVIEHIPLPGVDQVVAECFRVLEPDGRLILETLDPSNLNIFMGPFWADPGHRRPVHPWTLCVMCQSHGFFENRVVRSAPPPEEFRLHPAETEGLPEPTLRAIEHLNAELSKVNDSLYGPGQYAVIARKPRPGEEPPQ